MRKKALPASLVAEEWPTAPTLLQPLWQAELEAMDLVSRSGTLTWVVEPDGTRARMRGAFVAWLLKNYEQLAAEKSAAKFIGVAVVGVIDLNFAQALTAVGFDNCEIPDGLRLFSGHLKNLEFRHCTVGALGLGQCAVDNSLALFHTRVSGAMNLFGATIGGSFSINSCEIAPAQIVAIFGNMLKVGHIGISDSSISGRLSLVQATIDGDLSLSAVLLSPGGLALHADGLKVGSRLFLAASTRITGSVSLIGARIGGEINAGLLRIVGSGDEVALELRRSRVGGAIHLAGASVTGGVSLIACEVQGDLMLGGADICSSMPIALDLRSAKLRGACFFDDGFRIDGKVSIYGSEIGGELSLRDSSFGAGADVRRTRISAVHLAAGFSSRRFLDFYGSKIAGDFTIIGVSLDAAAWILLNSAEVGGTLHVDKSDTAASIEAVGATLGGIKVSDSQVGGPKAVALQLRNAHIRQSLSIDHAHIRGGISLTNAEVDGDVAFSDYRLEAGEAPFAFDATGAVIKGAYRTKDRRGVVQGSIGLRNCRVGSMEDAVDTWPWTGGLELDGLVYDRMPGASAADRLQWIRLQSQFHAQPYEQLTKLLRGRGDHAEASNVAIEKWRRRRAMGLDTSWQRFWDYLLDLLSGYGYRPIRPLLSLITLFAVGAIVFQIGRSEGVFCPADTLRQATPCVVKPAHPTFNPVIYSLETLVPVGDFGQKRTWIIRGDRSASIWITIYSVFHRALGWLFALLVALAPTNILRRE
ncbi:MAG TPA: hypothetical protein VF645_04280 [Allosphingosinicella sp.]|jgi:hypothetical protein